MDVTNIVLISTSTTQPNTTQPSLIQFITMSYADLDDSRHAEVLRRVAATTPFIPRYRSTVRKVTLDMALQGGSVRTSVEQSMSAVPMAIPVAVKFAASTEEVRYVARTAMKISARAISIQAPPGVGKSTVMPRVVDAEIEELVVVLEPTVVLAKAQVEAVRNMGGKAEYVDPTSATYAGMNKSMGIVYSTPAGLLAMLKREQAAPEIDRTAMVVIHDECHENDGATYALRTLWPDFRQIKKYILTSATLATQSKEAQQRHNSAPQLRLVQCRFKDELEFTGSDRLPDGSPAPWSIGFLHGKKALMFLERDKVADFVGAVYSHFMPVHVLRRDSTYEEYEVVAEQCKNAGPEGVLVVVDSAYQTGYSFDVDFVVDFGVRRQTVDSGVNQPQDHYREVTAAERRQRVERVARLRPGTAYVSDRAPSTASSVLGPGEAGHAAAWCRFLGYAIPANLKLDRAHLLDTADLTEFFSSQLPWNLWSREFYKEKPPVIVKPEPHRVEAEADDVALDSETEPMSIEAMMQWAGGLRAEIQAAALKSGEFYAMEDGSVVAEASVIEAIAGGAGDVYAWLRERIEPQSVRGLDDYTVVETSLIWAVWMTAWNTNVAKLVALTRWKTSCGGVPDDWHKSSVNRSVAANLFGMAEDVRDKWQLLKKWYQLLFVAHPTALSNVAEVSDLVEAQYRAVRAVLGVGMDTARASNPKAIPGDVRYMLTGDVSSTSSNSFPVYNGSDALVTIPRKAIALAKIAAADESMAAPYDSAAPWGSPERAIRWSREKDVAATVVAERDKYVGANTYVFPKKPGGAGYWK